MTAKSPSVFLGAAFEELLDWQHKEYESAGRAVIFKAGLRGRVRRHEGKVYVVAQKSAPDYSGIISLGSAIERETTAALINAGLPSLTIPGQPVYFDAKTTQDPKGWSLPRKSEHQLEALRRVARFGGTAFFLVECRPRHTAYLLMVHPSGVQPKIKFDDAADLIQVHEDNLGHLDWLSVLLS